MLCSDGDLIEPGHSTWVGIFNNIEQALDQMIKDLKHGHKWVQEEANNINGEADASAEYAKPCSKQFIISSLLVLYTSDEILQAQNLTGCHGDFRTGWKGIVRLVVAHVFFGG